MRELLATLRDEAFSEIEQAREGIKRKIRFPETDQVIKVAIGMRRVGKTYLLYQKIHQLLDQGIEKERILFIDFEDDRLLPLTTKKMADLIDEFYSIYPENHSRKCYIFLDEVQNVEDWNHVVRRIFKSKPIELIITGSSSKLLSTEISTSLRGRSLAIEVLPFSFEEFRTAHNLVVPKSPYSRQVYDVSIQQMREFFNKGGFPGVQQMQSHDWREALQGYVDAVILKDIIERHGVSNIALLKYLTKTLLINAATLFSINKFFNDIKSQGYKVGRETLQNYMTYLEDAFLIFRVPYYTESIRFQQTHASKVYVIDNGLINAYSVKIKDIYNKLLENQVYLDLRRQGKKVFYYKTKDGYEIDFVTKDKNGSIDIVQVAWEMDDPKTAERERRALAQAEGELGVKGRIITGREYAVTQCLIISSPLES
ncbi:MAG: ATP-binding protein [Coxiellaceae bacterium]|nr:ATP-binding protein [Coxiellaceae bacterium]